MDTRLLSKSVVPHVESKTERAQTGGWGRGPGNNVSDTMRGVNSAQDRMAAHMDRNFAKYFKAKRKARIMARRNAAPTPKVCPPVSKPVVAAPPAPIPQAALPRLTAGSTDVALQSWQTHALNRLRGKR